MLNLFYVSLWSLASSILCFLTFSNSMKSFELNDVTSMLSVHNVEVRVSDRDQAHARLSHLCNSDEYTATVTITVSYVTDVTTAQFHRLRT